MIRGSKLIYGGQVHMTLNSGISQIMLIFLSHQISPSVNAI